jgi:GDP-4-dehydro-6-deoxy-D-mannose reductase
MKSLITGINGFVGGWLKEHLLAEGDSVIGLPEGLDICDRKGIIDFMRSVEVDWLFHLAALTHVGQSWHDPEAFFRVNVIGTQNVTEALAESNPNAKMIYISSSEVYGQSLMGESSQNYLPINETTSIRPVTPYAASKVAAEFVALQGAFGRGLDVVIARPFNHVGPGQGEQFVVSGLAKRIVAAQIEGLDSIPVGNLDSERDFTDVRDVVRAYRSLAVAGDSAEAYNVCSGRAISIAEIAQDLIRLAGGKVLLRQDPSLMRAVEVKTSIGDSSKIAAATDWSPTISIDQTLTEILGFWRDRLRER